MNTTSRLTPPVSDIVSIVRSSLLIFLGALFVAPLTAAPQLKFAVIVTRHGVRSPTWEASRLNQYSAQPWPDWAVPTADLTPRGALLIQLMGVYYHDWFVSEKLLARQGCGDVSRIRIWADTSERTLATGRALGSSLLPGCKIATESRPEDETDPLFDPISAGVVKPDPALAVAAVKARLTPDLLDNHRAAFDALQQILGDGPKKLLDPPITISVKPSEDSAQLSGPFNTASTLSENLLLEYGNGFEGKDLGWGRLTETNLLKVLELHAVYADLMRRTPYLAKARGSVLMKRILQALEEAASGKSQDLLLVLSGHDTNLSNLSGMLGLSWQLPSYQPDDTPPGGALVFSLWRDEKGAFTVRTRYVAQTMSQMHKAIPLTLSSPPASADLLIPGCETASCNWTAFRTTVEKAISR